MTYLKYIGNGSYFPDVPARDLNEEEAKYYGVGRLVDSKLYEFAEPNGKGAVPAVEDWVLKGEYPPEEKEVKEKPARKSRAKDGEK